MLVLVNWDWIGFKAMLEINKIHLGNTYELIKEIDDKSIDLVVIDPPYEIDVEHGGGKNSITKRTIFQKGDLKPIAKGFDFPTLFDEFQRVCKLFNVFCFCSNSQISKLMMWGEGHNYQTTLLVWNKYNSIPFANGTWRQDAEFIVHIREKGAPLYGNAELKRKVKRLPIETKGKKWGHPTPKPLPLIKDYIEIGSKEGDLVLDCFSGSGTTAVACKELNRNFICIEKEEKYWQASNERLAETFKQGTLF